MPTLPDDLALAHRLADAADPISAKHFRSDDLLIDTKLDGSVVTAADQAVEKAMLAIVLTERPDDAVLGEEVGIVPGSNGRRWIFDGIDGTHNYAAGRDGWATMIALEIDGEVVLGVVTSPSTGRRFWAARGHGSWAATLDRDAGLGTPQRLQVKAADSLAAATVIVSPPVGFLIGWRDEVATRLDPTHHPRSRTFALDVAAIADGEWHAVVLLAGGVWDYAANVAIIEEAGGRFFDAWGGRRLDTTTAVFTTPGLAESLLATVAGLRPETPDVPIRSTRRPDR